MKVIDDADFSELGLPDAGPLLKKSNKSPLALILQPTRELAVQVKDHLQVAAAYTDITVCSVSYTDVFFNYYPPPNKFEWWWGGGVEEVYNDS